MKRIVRISMLALVCMAFFMAGLNSECEASTAIRYDAQKALAYAQEHWDDENAYDGGDQDCVKFAKACAEAGGIPKEERSYNGVEYGYTSADYLKYNTSNGFATLYKLDLTPHAWDSNRYYIDSYDNVGKISPGDLLGYYCSNCDKYIHLAVVAEADGLVTCYAHNVSKKGYYGDVITYPHTGCGGTDADMQLHSLHFKTNIVKYEEKVTGISAKRAAYNKIKISWNAAEEADGYKLYKKNSKNGSWNLLIDTTKTSITNKIATIGNTYYYKVIPYVSYIDENGKTVATSGKTSTVVYAKTYLAKPINVKVTKVGAGKLQVSWSKMSGAKGYQVYRSTSKNGKYTKVITTKNNKITNSRRVKGKTYYYKVRSYAVSGGKTVYSSFSTPVGKKMR